jgi:organic radical activating enzyme
LAYPVHETFYSVQGEGLHQGRAAFFIRLYGCPQGCWWCDSAGTWHPDYRPERVRLLRAAELAELAAGQSPPEALVVLTGGEPILFDLDPLCAALRRLGRLVHLETSGMAALRGQVDWVTLSPKPQGTWPLPEVVARADEVKLIVHDSEDIQAGLATLDGLSASAPIFLNPEWSRMRDGDRALLAYMVEAVKHNPRLRLGLQAHKFYQADLLDPASVKDLVPLGGNPELGY